MDSLVVGYSIDRENAGRYRTVPVMISGSTHMPPQPYLKGSNDAKVNYYKALEKSHTEQLPKESFGEAKEIRCVCPDLFVGKLKNNP